MGCCVSSARDDDERRNSEVETQIDDWRHKQRGIIKILLLGPGESGKSTIFKQMKILHDHGFTSDERIEYRNTIQKNGVESMQAIAQACFDLRITFESIEMVARAKRLLSIHLGSDTEPLEWNPREDIVCLLRDPATALAMQRSNEYYLMDSAQYWFQRVQDIYTPHYVPTEQDILHSRKATTGIAKFTFQKDKLEFRLFDVGGQRGERKKWIHCFDDVTALLFVASLSEYDQTLLEVRHLHRNRAVEALDLFAGILQLPWFHDTPIILFLNKEDIFREKIRHSPLEDYFPDYEGGENADAGIEFIQDLYMKCNPNPKKIIFPHVTTATNKANFRKIWKATRHLILQENLKAVGF